MHQPGWLSSNVIRRTTFVFVVFVKFRPVEFVLQPYQGSVVSNIVGGL